MEPADEDDPFTTPHVYDFGSATNPGRCGRESETGPAPATKSET